MSRDSQVLLDIVRAARLATEFAAGIDEAAFIHDLKTQSAVLHQLMLLGEAVKRLSEDFREQNPGIQWRLIAGMRDRLIHHYDDVDLEEVWKAVHGDLPELVAVLEPLTPRNE